MSTTVRLLAVGPDRFCPDCGRWLVRVKPGGTFDLAAKASVHWETEWDGESESADGFATQATCNRRLCRLRRWLRS